MLRYVPGSTVLDTINPDEGMILSSDNVRTKLKDSELYSHVWTPEGTQYKLGNKIRNFSKDSKEYQLEIDFYGSPATRASNINLFNEVTEKDVLNRTPGRLYLNEQYLKCYIVGSHFSKSEREGAVRNTASVYAPEQFWRTESVISLKNSGTEAMSVEEENKKSYPYTYACMYETLADSIMLANTHWTDCDFKIIIYGPADMPVINIGKNVYQIEYSIRENEYIEILSEEKTAVLVGSDGTRESVFDYRNKDYYLFEKIPPGNQTISWSGLHGADITLIEKRSEPDWI